MLTMFEFPASFLCLDKEIQDVYGLSRARTGNLQYKNLHNKWPRLPWLKCHRDWCKKSELAFCCIGQKVLPLERFYAREGQNDLFQGFKWGIVRIWYTYEIWLKISDTKFFYFRDFVSFYAPFCRQTRRSSSFLNSIEHYWALPGLPVSAFLHNTHKTYKIAKTKKYTLYPS